MNEITMQTLRDATGEIVTRLNEKAGVSIVKKHAGGRPSKYPTNAIELVERYLQEGKSKKDFFPMVEDIAIDVLSASDDAIVDWGKKHSEFGAVIKKVKQAQRRFLQKRVLGRFNPAGSMFLLKCLHGYVDTVRTEYAGEMTIKIIPASYQVKPIKLTEKAEGNKTLPKPKDL